MKRVDKIYCSLKHKIKVKRKMKIENKIKNNTNSMKQFKRFCAKKLSKNKFYTRNRQKNGRY